jgi:hypothetical protein
LLCITLITGRLEDFSQYQEEFSRKRAMVEQIAQHLRQRRYATLISVNVSIPDRSFSRARSTSGKRSGMLVPGRNEERNDQIAQSVFCYGAAGFAGTFGFSGEEQGS